MTKYVGVDWASKGWFGVVLKDDDSWETDHFPTIWSLWNCHSDASRIFIDIPIGLPSGGKRNCDVEARQKLKQQGRSVFYTPTREAVYQQNINEAKKLNKKAGFSIQNQAWHIVPRIREVDEFLEMNPNARDQLFETHPEICFYSLNNQEAVVSKKTDDGVSCRKSLLEREHQETITIYKQCCNRYLRPNYASFVHSKDDILDALVAAVTAKRPQSELSNLPEEKDTQRDARGITMEIVYPSANCSV